MSKKYIIIDLRGYAETIDSKIGSKYFFKKTTNNPNGPIREITISTVSGNRVTLKFETYTQRNPNWAETQLGLTVGFDKSLNLNFLNVTVVNSVVLNSITNGIKFDNKKSLVPQMWDALLKDRDSLVNNSSNAFAIFEVSGYGQIVHSLLSIPDMEAPIIMLGLNDGANPDTSVGVTLYKDFPPAFKDIILRSAISDIVGPIKVGPYNNNAPLSTTLIAGLTLPRQSSGRYWYLYDLEGYVARTQTTADKMRFQYDKPGAPSLKIDISKMLPGNDIQWEIEGIPGVSGVVKLQSARLGRTYDTKKSLDSQISLDIFGVERAMKILIFNAGEIAAPHVVSNKSELVYLNYPYTGSSRIEGLSILVLQDKLLFEEDLGFFLKSINRKEGNFFTGLDIEEERSVTFYKSDNFYINFLIKKQSNNLLQLMEINMNGIKYRCNNLLFSRMRHILPSSNGEYIIAFTKIDRTRPIVFTGPQTITESKDRVIYNLSSSSSFILPIPSSSIHLGFLNELSDKRPINLVPIPWTNKLYTGITFTINNGKSLSENAFNAHTAYFQKSTFNYQITGRNDRSSVSFYTKQHQSNIIELTLIDINGEKFTVDNLAFKELEVKDDKHKIFFQKIRSSENVTFRSLDGGSNITATKPTEYILGLSASIFPTGTEYYASPEWVSRPNLRIEEYSSITSSINDGQKLENSDIMNPGLGRKIFVLDTAGLSQATINTRSFEDPYIKRFVLNSIDDNSESDQARDTQDKQVICDLDSRTLSASIKTGNTSYKLFGVAPHPDLYDVNSNLVEQSQRFVLGRTVSGAHNPNFVAFNASVIEPGNDLYDDKIIFATREGMWPLNADMIVNIKNVRKIELRPGFGNGKELYVEFNNDSGGYLNSITFDGEERQGIKDRYVQLKWIRLNAVNYEFSNTKISIMSPRYKDGAMDEFSLTLQKIDQDQIINMRSGGNIIDSLGNRPNKNELVTFFEISNTRAVETARAALAEAERTKDGKIAQKKQENEAKARACICPTPASCSAVTNVGPRTEVGDNSNLPSARYEDYKARETRCNTERDQSNKIYEDHINDEIKALKAALNASTVGPISTLNLKHIFHTPRAIRDYFLHEKFDTMSQIDKARKKIILNIAPYTTITTNQSGIYETTYRSNYQTESSILVPPSTFSFETKTKLENDRFFTDLQHWFSPDQDSGLKVNLVDTFTLDGKTYKTENLQLSYSTGNPKFFTFAEYDRARVMKIKRDQLNFESIGQKSNYFVMVQNPLSLNKDPIMYPIMPAVFLELANIDENRTQMFEYSATKKRSLVFSGGTFSNSTIEILYAKSNTLDEFAEALIVNGKRIPFVNSNVEAYMSTSKKNVLIVEITQIDYSQPMVIDGMYIHDGFHVKRFLGHTMIDGGVEEIRLPDDYSAFLYHTNSEGEKAAKCLVEAEVPAWKKWLLRITGTLLYIMSAVHIQIIDFGGQNGIEKAFFNTFKMDATFQNIAKIGAAIVDIAASVALGGGGAGVTLPLNIKVLTEALSKGGKLITAGYKAFVMLKLIRTLTNTIGYSYAAIQSSASTGISPTERPQVGELMKKFKEGLTENITQTDPNVERVAKEEGGEYFLYLFMIYSQVEDQDKAYAALPDCVMDKLVVRIAMAAKFAGPEYLRKLATKPGKSQSEITELEAIILYKALFLRPRNLAKQFMPGYHI